MGELAPGSPDTFSHEVLKPRTPYDALHLSGYGIVGPPDNRIPQLYGQLEIDAAMHLLQRGFTKNVVIGGVQYGSPHNEPVSAFYANVLRDRLAQEGIGDVTIFAEAEMLGPDNLDRGARDTNGEMLFLKTMAIMHDWRRVIYMYHKPHNTTIQMLLDAHHLHRVTGPDDIEENAINIFPQSATKVLQKYDFDYWNAYTFNEDNRRADASFRRLQSVKNVWMRLFDPSGSRLTWIARHIPDDAKDRIQRVLYRGE